MWGTRLSGCGSRRHPTNIPTCIWDEGVHQSLAMSCKDLLGLCGSGEVYVLCPRLPMALQLVFKGTGSWGSGRVEQHHTSLLLLMRATPKRTLHTSFYLERHCDTNCAVEQFWHTRISATCNAPHKCGPPLEPCSSHAVDFKPAVNTPYLTESTTCIRTFGGATVNTGSQTEVHLPHNLRAVSAQNVPTFKNKSTWCMGQYEKK